MKKLLTLTSTLLLLASVCQADETVKVADLTFKTPAPWKSVESTSPMRAAILHYPVEGSDKPLEAVFYYFGAGQGGDVEANITRWLGQFEGQPTSKREELPAGDKKVSLVIADGTYLDGPPFGGTKTPRPDYTMLGAIVPGADANIFVKLTGPKDAVAKALESFKALITSPY
jgi:hypothetical protein